MSVQALAVAIIVGICAVYAAWVLMPAVWRRPLAKWLLAWPVLARSRALRRAATAQSGCGCDGCDAPPSTSTQAQPVHIVRRR